MNELFEKYKNELQSAVVTPDCEDGHWQADQYLKNIALDAARGNLSVDEVTELIELYDRVEKWYS